MDYSDFFGSYDPSDDIDVPLCNGNGEVVVHCGHMGTDPDCTCTEYECPGCEACMELDTPDYVLDPERFVPGHLVVE